MPEESMKQLVWRVAVAITPLQMTKEEAQWATKFLIDYEATKKPLQEIYGFAFLSHSAKMRSYTTYPVSVL